MKPAPRARAEANARALEAFLAAHPARDAALLEAVSKDPAWIDRGVSYTTVWQDVDADQPFPRVVGRALAALTARGALTPRVGDETGSYIAMLLDEKPPANVSFAEASARLRDDMYEPWRRQRFLRLSMDMAAGHEVEVFPDNLALLERAPGAGDDSVFAPTTTSPSVAAPDR